MLEDFQGDSWGSIPPLRMSSLLPHDLCHGRSASCRPPTVMSSCTEYIMEMFSTTRCVVLVPWVPISKVGVKVPGDAWIFSVLSDRKKTLNLGILGQWQYALSIPPFLMRERFSLHYGTANMPSMSLQGATVSILQGCSLYKCLENLVWDEAWSESPLIGCTEMWETAGLSLKENSPTPHSYILLILSIVFILH